MSIMSCYYQPVSEEVKCLHITCHAGTESESGYSHSQTLTFKLEGGGGGVGGGMDVQGHAPAFPLGKDGANSYTIYATSVPF
jgi:hypothetical protein